MLAAEKSSETGEAVTLKGAAGPMPLPAAPVDDLSPAPGGPALTVVLVAADGYAGVRRVVRHVRDQTIAGQIEVLLIAPDESDAAPFDAAETAGLHSSRVITTGGPIPDVDAAAAHGIRASAAPVVASVEDHAYPEPTWAAALLDAYRAPGGPWAAVGIDRLQRQPRPIPLVGEPAAGPRHLVQTHAAGPRRRGQPAQPQLPPGRDRAAVRTAGPSAGRST